MTPYTARVESLSACLDEYEALMALTGGPRPYPVRPDTSAAPSLEINREALAGIDAAGLVAFVTLRDCTGKLGGIALAIVGPHPHYTTTITAQVDVFVVLPDAPGGADALHRVLEAELKRRGVARVFMRSRLDEAHPLDLAAYGFKAVECHHAKWVAG